MTDPRSNVFDMGGVRAMPTARATHASHRATHASHRAVLHRLGLSVGIAIAVAGCSARHDWKADEVQPQTYLDIQRGLEGAPANDPERLMVKRFMADGIIDYRELEQLNEHDAEERNRAVNLPSVKAELASERIGA